MRFRMVLWLLGRLFKRANVKKEGFRKLAAKKDIVFQLMTKDQSVSRNYEFRKGVITSRSGIRRDAALSLVFKDAAYAVSVLLSKDKEAFQRGIMAGDIEIEGNMDLLIRFQNLTRLMKGKAFPIPPNLSRIGVVGVGLIGAPMAESLMRCGFTVKAFDASPKALSKTVGKGAVGCSALDDLKDVDAVLVIVSTMAQVEEVVLRLADIIPDPARVPIAIMSTVSPDSIRDLRKKLDDMGKTRLDMVDAPVSGMPLLAKAGKLAIMVGGEKRVFDYLKPVFNAMGEPDKIFHMGELGSGSSMKLVNNIIGFTTAINVIESFHLGWKKGLHPDTMADVVNASSGRNFVTEQWPMTKKMLEMMLADTTYNAKSAMFTTGLKDLETARDWGLTDNIHVPCITNAINQINGMSEEEFLDTVTSLVRG